MPEKPPGGEVLPFGYPERYPQGEPWRRPETPRAILAAGWVYRVHCQRCNQWRFVDLQRLVRLGQGNRSVLGRRLICRDCGRQGHGEIRPLPSPL